MAYRSPKRDKAEYYENQAQQLRTQADKLANTDDDYSRDQARKLRARALEYDKSGDSEREAADAEEARELQAREQEKQRIEAEYEAEKRKLDDDNESRRNQIERQKQEAIQNIERSGTAGIF